MQFHQVSSKFREFGSGCKARSGNLLRATHHLILLVFLISVPTLAGAQTPLLQSSVSSVRFGNVLVGTKIRHTVTYTNTGNSSATITRVLVTGTGFTHSPLNVPLTLSPGQSLTFTVNFLPPAVGASEGALKLLTNAAVTTAVILLTGTGTTQSPSLSINPANLAFGDAPTGSTNSLTVSLSNTGTSVLGLSQVTISGTAFSMSGLSTPLNLAPAQSSSFTVSFHPAAVGTATGSISLISSSSSSPVKIVLSGSGTQAHISIVPAAVNFGNLAVGLTNSQTVAVSNPGNTNLSLTQSAGPGAGFGISGLALPMTVAPGKSATFTLSFHPTSTGALASSLVLVSNVPGSPTTIPVSGTGTASANQLSSSPASVNFGTDLLGTTTAQNATLTNTGTVKVTISQISVSPGSFSATVPALPITLLAGQSAGFSVSFTPSIAGSFTGTASVISTATNSPLPISLSGSGSQTSHSVVFDWAASTSDVVGYFVYSGKQVSGPFTKLNSVAVSKISYKDDSVQSGQTYYYVATAVDSTGVESANSNVVTVTIP